MRVAAALSEHPLPTHAVGEATGDVLEQLGTKPDLAMVFVTSGHAGALEDITGAVRSILRPKTLVGTAATSVIGGHREVEERPGVTVWAARCGGVDPVRIRTERGDDGWTVQGLPAKALDGDRTLVIFADPFTFPTEGFLSQLSETCPRLTVVGGLTSGARGAGGSRLVLDGEVHVDGAVGVLLKNGADVAALVSQGCRPVGVPFVVTRAEGNMIHELGGQPAVERLRELVEGLDPDDRVTATRGLLIGMVIDEQRATFGPGDFLIRNVLGADPEIGAVSVAELIEVGQTVQFHLRDGPTADSSLRSSLSGLSGDGALIFAAATRGQSLFGYPDHDADVAATSLGTNATAGFFGTGEIGPVGDRSYLHGFSASILVFGAGLQQGTNQS